MQLTIEQLRSATAFTVMLVIASAAHIALGVTYIQYGEYVSQFQAGDSLYKQVLPFSAFAIVVGCLLFLYVLVGNVSLRGSSTSSVMINASWNGCWITTGLSFAVTVIAILVFAKFTVIIRDAGISFSELPDKVGAVYWCSLVDGIVGLFLAFPAGFKMMAIENDHRLDDGLIEVSRNMEMTSAQNPQYQQYNPNVNFSPNGQYNPQMNTRWN